MAATLARGIAIPRAHGQAITRTVIILTRATSRECPIAVIATPVARATRMTTGPKTAMMRSVRRSVGFFCIMASSIRAIILPMALEDPTPVTRIRSSPDTSRLRAEDRIPGPLCPKPGLARELGFIDPALSG